MEDHEDGGRMDQRQQWQGGLEASHLKELFRDHPAMKLMDVLAERDAAMAERETAVAERKTAYAERDAALLQRDVAYADRNAAWMERDTALAALSMVRANHHNHHNHHHHHSNSSNSISFNTTNSSSNNNNNNSNNNNNTNNSCSNNSNSGSLSCKDCPSPDYASKLMHLVHLPHIDSSTHHHHPPPPPPHALLQTFPDCHNRGALRGLNSARNLQKPQTGSSKQQEDCSSTPRKRKRLPPRSTPHKTLPKDPYHRQQQQLLRSPDMSYPKDEQQGTPPTTTDATTTAMAMATATTEPGTTTGFLDPDHPYDMLTTPIPYCSCTGSQQQCYRWGKGGWQSACCTNVVSLYPLPMSSTKRGVRIPGRKMSGGAFKKILDKLSADGVDVSMPIDLKDHWAKHGTNRYVTIK